jgi:Na+-translocating ferredoxin:NAD+ oxidoreductase subunit B
MSSNPAPPFPVTNSDLVARLDVTLPQTQCQRCGFDACLPYAQAMAKGVAAPNRCPPGGPDGLKKLSSILAEPQYIGLTLDPTRGAVGPRTVAYIREDLCIGCTKCIDVCPTDAIVGATKKLHFVIQEYCTGCDLCLPPCPVDCITITPLTQQERFSWQDWSSDDANRSKVRFHNKQLRISTKAASSQSPVNLVSPEASKEESIGTALERARAKAKLRLKKLNTTI